MTTKQYEFTEEEVILLRDACLEYFHNLSNAESATGEHSERRQRIMRVARGLSDQFRTDATAVNCPK